MSFKDLREFVSFLEQRGELKRVTAPVSSELEITEITDRMVKSGGPALLFENVDGGTTPLLINIFGTHRRTALALGVEDIEELSDRVRGLFKMVQGPPTGLGGKLHALGELMGLARSQPKTVRRAPCQEVVLTGRRGRSVQDADHQVLALRRRTVHHSATGYQSRPCIRQEERRDVPDAGVRQEDDGYALADAQGRARAMTVGRGSRDSTGWRWRSLSEPIQPRCGRGRCLCRPTWTS